MFQHKLERLGQEFDALQQAAQEPAGRANVSFAERLAGLRRSVDELRLLAAPAARGQPGAPKLQSERPRRAHEAARRDRPMRFRELAEQGSVLVRVMDAGTGCRWANRAWLAFTGRSLEQTVGDGWLRDVHPEDRARCAPSAAADGPGGSRQGQPFERVEYRLRSASGEYGWVLEIGSPRLASGRGVGGHLRTAVDITEFKQAEANLALEAAAARALAEAEARKAAILDAALDGVITIDAHGRVLEFNTAAQSMFGYPREQALGKGLVDLVVTPRMRQMVQNRFAHYHATGKSDLIGRRFGAVAMRADGAQFPIDVALAPTGQGTPPLVTIYVCDATARRQAEEEVRNYRERLRALMSDLVLVEERERRRLSVDLHDGLIQTIALAKLRLAALQHPTISKLRGPLKEIETLIEQANRTARSISFELSPPVLHDLGLEPAVEWLVEDIQERYGISVELERDVRPKPADEKTRVILFRAIRELLINAARHAGVGRVSVGLEREQDCLHARVEDEGIGMDPESEMGFGLLSIRERMSHVGGSMQIVSAPGRGTKVRLSAPLTAISRKPRRKA